MPPDLAGRFFLTPADALLFLAIPFVLVVVADGKSLLRAAWLDVRLRRDESVPGCV